MIKFFRQYRKNLIIENKTSKYLKYAIGEIILVVIGILIALHQINNANEAYKAKQSEQVVLKNLVQDSNTDSLSFRDNLAMITKVNTLHQTLYEIGVKGMDLEIENPNLIRFMIYYNPIAIKNDPFVAGKISNETIRKEILANSRYLKDLDDAYSEFAELIENRVRVFLTDKKVPQLSYWFENNAFSKQGVSFEFVGEADLIQLSKTPEFQQLLLEASIKSKNKESNIETVLTQNQKLKDVIFKEFSK